MSKHRGSFFYSIKQFAFILTEAKKQILMAFSVYTNGRKLLSSKKSKSKDVVHCVHGIRVFSTQWVVLGHTYSFYDAYTSNNIAFLRNVSYIGANVGARMIFLKSVHFLYYSSSSNFTACTSCQQTFQLTLFSCSVAYSLVTQYWSIWKRREFSLPRKMSKL